MLTRNVRGRLMMTPWLCCSLMWVSGAIAAQESSGGVRADRLATTVGQPITLSLALPDDATWAEANVGQFIVRQSGGQRTVETDAAASRELVLVFEQPGYALVAVGVGSASQKGFRDSWQRTTHCTKFIVRVSDGSRKATPPGTGLTAKVGGKAEIVPLMDPTRMSSGDDLPVRCYLEGDKLVGQPVTAIAPDGTLQSGNTDAVGATHFRVTHAGRWTVRFEREVEGVTYTAELIFDVPAPGVAEESRQKGDES
ncbi:MAG: hypothetical protein FLDDKLPJ_01537 [Phycisphaerae bacterium]|nr:hypothetical protein [Phycisphaerae bacterium]